MYFELDIYGDKQFAAELMRWAEAAQDLDPVFRLIEADFYRIEKEAFATEGSRAEAWAALSEPYATRKAIAYPGKTILRRTDAMYESLTNPASSLRRITADDMFIGTDVTYAVFHQLGTVKMPRRRPVSLTAGDRRRWQLLLQRYLATGEATTAFLPGL